MYISETASVHLGLPQIDLTGSSIFEYIHPADQDDVRELFKLTESDKVELAACQAERVVADEEPQQQFELSRSFCMRMKCILPKRNAGLVSNGYKAIHCSGYLKIRVESLQNTSTTREQTTTVCPTEINSNQQKRKPRKQNFELEGFALIAVGQSLLPSASVEVKLVGNSSFMFHAFLDFKLNYVEDQVYNLLGFGFAQIIGQSLYQLVHVDDMSSLEEAHKKLLRKSQVVTKYFRLMKQDGGFVWVQVYASLVNNPRQMPKPQHIVGFCFVLGENTSDQSSVLLENSLIGELQLSESSSKLTNHIVSKKPLQMQHRKHTTIEQLTTAASNKRKAKVLNLKKSCKIDTSAVSPFLTNSFSSRGKVGELKRTDYSQQSLFNDSYLSESTSCYTNSCFVADIPFKTQRIRAYEQATIGSIRRPSDDSSSIVSSSASTSVSSNVSLGSRGQDFLTQSYTDHQIGEPYHKVMVDSIGTTVATSFNQQAEIATPYEEQQVSEPTVLLDMTGHASNTVSIVVRPTAGNDWPNLVCQATEVAGIVDLTTSHQNQLVGDQIQASDYYYHHHHQHQHHHPDSWTSMQLMADTSNNQPAHQHQQEQYFQQQHPQQCHQSSGSYYQSLEFQVVEPEFNNESPNLTECNEAFSNMKHGASLRFYQQTACLSNGYTS